MLIKMEEADLETLYMPSRWCFRRCDTELAVQNHIEIVSKESASVQQEIPFESNVRYGTGPRQLMHIFYPTQNETKDVPTFIYIHGGYWQELSKDISCYCVKPLIKSGARVVIPGYDLAPDAVIKSLFHDQCGYIPAHNRSIWLSGHSAGAHLASGIFCTDLYSQISGFILISGIYDLTPLLKTSVNDALKLSEKGAIAGSPIHQLLNRTLEYHGVVLLVVGEHESPAFHHQQLQFLKVLQSKGVQVYSETISNTDHFSVVELLSSDEYSLTKTVLKVIHCRTDHTLINFLY